MLNIVTKSLRRANANKISFRVQINYFYNAIHLADFVAYCLMFQ